MSHHHACDMAVGSGGPQRAERQQRKRGGKPPKTPNHTFGFVSFQLKLTKARCFSNPLPAWGVMERSPRASVGACIALP